MTDSFREKLLKYTKDFYDVLATKDLDWAVKGFIDISKNVYTISGDTKVISKVIELMLFPILQKFATKNKYKMELSKEQNYYPDITFIKNNKKIALDIKSTYRKDKNIVSGFTLGAFTGYFRDRNLNKNITFPYNQYHKHYILGVIYSQNKKCINEKNIYNLSDIEKISSVIRDFEFIIQEKYLIASDRAGSGNTKNIGSYVLITELKNGTGHSSKLGIKIFDDFLMNYMTEKKKKKVDLKKTPYHNLSEYMKYRNIKNVK